MARRKPKRPQRPNHWKEIIGGHRYVFGTDNDIPLTVKQIAQALAQINRFGGHARCVYTVAQHSVFCSQMLDFDPHLAMAALLHDAPEMIIGDIVSPMKWQFGKRWMAPVQAEEQRAMRTIVRALGVPQFERFDDFTKAAVKRADLVAVVTEKRDLMSKAKAVRWETPEYQGWPPAHPQKVEPVGPADAAALFVQRFKVLKRRLAA